MSGVTGETRIALAGCGAVGGAFIELVDAWVTPHSLDAVLVRDVERRRAGPLGGLRFTDDPSALLAAEADVVVEAMGGVELASDLARATLTRGAAFVTANKTLVASCGPELAELAAVHGGALRFDAAVGGGVPIVRTLRSTFVDVPIRRISGILNGTANFLLTKFEEGEGAAEALATAQSAGYAEADPSRDLDGRDVADKAAILAWVAWGVRPEDVRIDREGLPTDAADRARSAVSRGRRLRLVVELRPDGRGGAAADIECREVPAASELGRTSGVRNTVQLGTDCGDYSLTGPGAGGRPTALALLADVRAAVERCATSPLRSLA